MRKSYATFATVVLLVSLTATAEPLQETSAHSILKHLIIDTIVKNEKVTRVVDLFGGAIIYTDRQGNVEVGSAGRIIMNGRVTEYYINDILYTETKGQTHPFTPPGQQTPVQVHVTAQEFSKAEMNSGKYQNFAGEVLTYLKEHPLGAKESQIVIVDPYWMLDSRAWNFIREGVKGDTRFLIFSPLDRSKTNPLGRCDGLVYSETDKKGTVIKKSDGDLLTYTLFGYGIKSWKSSIEQVCQQFPKDRIRCSQFLKDRNTGTSTSEIQIQTDQKPQNLDNNSLALVKTIQQYIYPQGAKAQGTPEEKKQQ
jgi:hypothetical protein